jgi:hypothetical protein
VVEAGANVTESVAVIATLLSVVDVAVYATVSAVVLVTTNVT